MAEPGRAANGPGRGTPQRGGAARSPGRHGSRALPVTIGERLREWALAEIAPGRLMPWLPICVHRRRHRRISRRSGSPRWSRRCSSPAAASWRRSLARRRAVAFPLLLGLGRGGRRVRHRNA